MVSQCTKQNESLESLGGFPPVLLYLLCYHQFYCDPNHLRAGELSVQHGVTLTPRRGLRKQGQEPMEVAKWLVAVPSHVRGAKTPQSETCTSTPQAGKSASEEGGLLSCQCSCTNKRTGLCSQQPVLKTIQHQFCMLQA